MREFIYMCGLLLWTISLFVPEFIVLNYGGIYYPVDPKWWIIGPCAVVTFFNIVAFITYIYKKMRGGAERN